MIAIVILLIRLGCEIAVSQKTLQQRIASNEFIGLTPDEIAGRIGDLKPYDTGRRGVVRIDLKSWGDQLGGKCCLEIYVYDGKAEEVVLRPTY